MAAPDKPRQLPLGFHHAPAFARDDLVVSPSNSDAVALIERWPSWPSSLVVLSGPPGSGKSHLGAIWRERSGAAQAQPARLSERQHADPSRTTFVDDADSPELDEKGLFHVLNAAREAGSQILLASRRRPSAWTVSLRDLASRLKAATIVEIHEPDDLLLSGVITKLFADRQVQIDSAVVQFMSRRMERSLSEATRLVERLDALALERQTRITRNLAAELFEEDAGQGDLF